MKALSRVVGAVLGVAILAAAGAGWLMARDPLAALPRAAGPPALGDQRSERRPGRLMLRQELSDTALGRIGLALSLPDPLPGHPLPVLIVLGGLATGADNIRAIPAPGDNALVGYTWPLPLRLPRGLDFVRAAPELRRRAVSVPGQVVAAMDWLAVQPWADRGRISLLGFSLGALVAPAVHRLAAESGHAIGWTVLAYGGTDLGGLLARHPRIRPAWARPLVAGVGNLALNPLEPARHLPHISGRFLVVSGRADTLIPAWSSKRFAELTPRPRTVVVLGGDHMGVGPGQRELLAEIVRVSRRWLVDQGAVDPP